MYAGAKKDDKTLEEIVYFGINAHWEKTEVELPEIPEGYVWKLYVDTGREPDQVITEDDNVYLYNRRITMEGRSVIAAVADKI